jgi:hypothetical protein
LKGIVVAMRCNSNVLVWYTAHNQIDRRDFDLVEKYGSPIHPLLGYYNPAEDEVVKSHIKWIRRGAIDVLVYSIFSTSLWSVYDIEKDKALPKIISQLENQGTEERKLKICFIMENYIDYWNMEQLNYIFSYLKDRFFDKPYYFHYRKKPLIMFFVNDNKNESIDKLTRENLDCEMRKIWWNVPGDQGWLYIEKYPQTVRKDFMPVSPGFNSLLEDLYIRDQLLKEPDNKLYQRFCESPYMTDEEVKKRANRQSWENTKFYQKQLKWAVKNNPENIFISGWNDWEYENPIEPSKEYKFKFVDITAKLLGRESEVKKYVD